MNNFKNIDSYFTLDSSLFRISVNRLNYSSVELAVLNGIPRRIAILSKLVNYPDYNFTGTIDGDWQFALERRNSYENNGCV